MRAFLLRRLLQTVAVVFLVATATFFLIRLAPGDVVDGVFAGTAVTDSVRQMWRARWGLDKPLPEQYGRFLSSVARGELGHSHVHNRPVREVLATALPRTLLLMSVALCTSFGLGMALGVLQAVRRGSAVDRVATAVSLFFFSMPDFWLALMAMLVFAYWLRWLPTGGICDPVLCPYFTPLQRALDVARHMVLPVGTLTLLLAAGIARYQRSATLDVLHQDYVRTARAKGASERTVLVRHVMRNALLPVITLAGLAFPFLLGGAVFIETVFSWQGMGYITVYAISTRDYHLVVAAVIVGGTLVSVGSLLADVLYAAVDPRLRTT